MIVKFKGISAVHVGVGVRELREPHRPCQLGRLLACTEVQCTRWRRRREEGASVFHTLSINYSGSVGVLYSVQLAATASPPQQTEHDPQHSDVTLSHSYNVPMSFSI